MKLQPCASARACSRFAIFRPPRACGGFEDRPATGDILPEVSYTMADGSIRRRYYRTTLKPLNGASITAESALPDQKNPGAGQTLAPGFYVYPSVLISTARAAGCFFGR